MLLKAIEKLQNLIAVAAMVLMWIVITGGAVLRSIDALHLPWLHELIQVCFSVFLWIALASATRRNEHIRITALHDLIKSPRVLAALHVSSLIISALFMLGLVWVALDLNIYYWETKARLPLLRWSTLWIRAPLLIGSFLSLIWLLVQIGELWTNRRRGGEPHALDDN